MQKRSISLMIIFLITFGCQSEEIPQPAPMDDLSQHENQPDSTILRYLALGDSYTIGHGVPEKDRYPVQLVDTLARHGVSIDSLRIIARTGWTTDELMAALDAGELHPPYDLVTLLIGVNNQYRGRSPESYRPEFVALLQRAIEYAGGEKDRVVVLSIPDWGFTPFATGRDREKISAEIDMYNQINQYETEQMGVIWVDVTTISREGLNRPELVAQDGLHPSGIMYAYWVNDVYPHVLQMFLDEK